MNTEAILSALFHRRRDASWKAYIPVLLVVSTFLIIGILNRGLVKELYLFALLLIGVAQLRYRTLAGWLLLFSACVLYASVAAYQVFLVFLQSNTSLQAREHSILFLVCGLASALALFVYRPWKPVVPN